MLPARVHSRDSWGSLDRLIHILSENLAAGTHTRCARVLDQLMKNASTRTRKRPRLLSWSPTPVQSAAEARVEPRTHGDKLISVRRDARVSRPARCEIKLTATLIIMKCLFRQYFLAFFLGQIVQNNIFYFTYFFTKSINRFFQANFFKICTAFHY